MFEASTLLMTSYFFGFAQRSMKSLSLLIRNILYWLFKTLGIDFIFSSNKWKKVIAREVVILNDVGLIIVFIDQMLNKTGHTSSTLSRLLILIAMIDI